MTPDTTPTTDDLEGEIALLREAITLSRGEQRARLKRVLQARLSQLAHMRRATRRR